MDEMNNVNEMNNDVMANNGVGIGTTIGCVTGAGLAVYGLVDLIIKGIKWIGKKRNKNEENPEVIVEEVD